MNVSQTHPSHVHELASDQCWELASSQPVGRLAWSGPAGVTVIPVNFELDGETVQLRTSAYSALGRECDDSLVAFQVDAFDAAARTGWSVLMRGRAHLDYTGGVNDAEPEVWAGGTRALRVTVDVTEVSGRRIG